MAGIYIHIPFCKQKCNYCDFYSITSFHKKEELLTALNKELIIRKDYLKNELIDTIYFGGGTPSLLNMQDVGDILTTINDNYSVSKNPEITIEVNPDDVSFEYFKDLIKLGIKRLSIGIQSFNDNALEFLNRRHSSNQAIEAVKNAQKAGFKNISIDLIYGIPCMSFETWTRSTNTAISLNIQHISAYHLSIEKNTPLFKMLSKNEIAIINENESFKQFSKLVEMVKQEGFEHYEISNFARKNFYSQHNSNYWKQKKYIGVGPSAHSFDFTSRQWNVSNISQYIDFTNTDKKFYSTEILTKDQKYNDYIITALRTIWGIDLTYIENNFGTKYHKLCVKQSEKYIDAEHIIFENNKLTLSVEGMFISDTIISEMLYINK